MNNALRKDAIKLDDREQLAFTKSKTRLSNRKLGSGRNSQFSGSKRQLQLDANYKAYCSSYSRRGRDSGGSQSVIQVQKLNSISITDA